MEKRKDARCIKKLAMGLVYAYKKRRNRKRPRSAGGEFAEDVRVRVEENARGSLSKIII